MKTQSQQVRLGRTLCFSVLALLTHALNGSVLRASMPHFVGDGELVDRSEWIVLGRLQGDSVRQIKHPRGFSSEHHATLVINDIVKGDFKNQQITLLIRHGVEVRIKDGKVAIEDNVTQLPRATIADARQDQIWFLRKLQSGDGQPDAPMMWGVNEIHDVQSIDMLEYFKILLSPKPESKVREYLKAHPRLAVRAVEYLESRELKRILAEPDPAIRSQKLLPYYLGASHDSTQRSASRALIDGGPESGPYLMAAFQKLQHRRQRPGIIQMLGRTGYTGAADMLVGLLDENHRDYLNLHGRMERDGPESGIEPEHVRRLAYEVRAAIYALAEIGDPRAEKLIAETMRRWKDIPSAQQGVLAGCYSALEITQRRSQDSK